VRLFGILTTFFFPFVAFTFAHRALWAAAIRARLAADILFPRLVCFPYAEPNAASAAPIP
jgi:hypothetical protein